MARGGAHPLSPVAAYVAERTGSSLSVQQVSRLRVLIDARLGAQTEEELLRHLRSHAGAADLAELMSAIAVHKTDLFRDEVQLRAFDHNVLRPLARASSRPLHVWSAGCATGEEVATLLILLTEAGAHSQSTVLGTDISEPALKQARELAFHPAALKRLPQAYRHRYFDHLGSHVQLVPELRARATFARHNLMDAPYPVSPGGQGFDVIFCRNVLIYFTEAAFEQVVDGLTERLKVGGTLVLSAAEPLLRPKGPLGFLKCEEAFFYVRHPEPVAPGGPLFATPRPGAPAHPPRSSSPPPSAETPRAPLPAAGSFRGSGETPRMAIPAVISTRPGETPRLAMPAVVPARPPGETPRLAMPAVPNVAFSRPPGQTPQLPLAVTPTGTPLPAPIPEDPVDEARQIFELVLDWAAAGDAEAQTEQGLRRCLYLDPHFAQARYLLGMLLEQRGERAEAATEYRRALAALKEGRSRQTPFFLNDGRLQTACAAALERVGFRSGA
ncbi:MAG TPA: CheR family methyltransferase [Myxococcales bacterium]|nr:CheR family methyltransferase [Myxococcales bacterium]